MINGKIIKVCGMRHAENIRDVERIEEVDMLGFIFYPKSPRFVNTLPTQLPQRTLRVGVFVNESSDAIAAYVNRFGLHYAQLHGNESPEYCLKLRQTGIKIIKAFSIATAKDIQNTCDYQNACDLFLFDTRTKGYGGSGVSFDWNLLYAYNGNLPFLLSGGLAPNSAETVAAFEHPLLAGYDLNSRFETEPARKNPKQIEQFLTSLNQNIQKL